MRTRPELKKIVFSYQPDDVLLETVRSEVPGSSVVVAEKDALRKEISGAQLVIGGRIDDEALALADELVWQHVTWAGVESIVSPGLVERGVTLTNSRGVSAPNMAEHVVAMMLAFGRAIPFFVKMQKERRWKPWEDQPPFFELNGQTVVLLGTGAIGRATAERLRPFGCRIVGARRRAGAVEGFDKVVSFAELGDVLAEADHIVSSLPMTPFTSKLLSSELIGKTKLGAHFFNVGRGGTVDQDALIAALQSGQLAGAGLDVTDPEPLPQDSLLWAMPNVLITSHTSGGSPIVVQRVAALLGENLRRYQDGGGLVNVVDFEHGY
jgi:phosphoglycerate dehydrogenase-like enzyme